MRTAGIIAEYNPFHNGHKYHIEETRRQTGADYIIAVISGDFVQRGAPALLSKYDRALMALQNGADLVFELPVTAALSSAEGFAAGGVSLLSGLGVVDILSCGCESAGADPALFAGIASVLTDEPEVFRKSLSLHLKKGLSFPKARETAVSEYLSEEVSFRIGQPQNTQDKNAREYPDTDFFSDVHRLLSEPNNILALEYAKAIRKSGSSMEMCMIPRQGHPYHSKVLSDSFRGSGFPYRCASAAAIRKFLLSHTGNGSDPAQGVVSCTGNSPDFAQGIVSRTGNSPDPAQGVVSCTGNSPDFMMDDVPYTDSVMSGADYLYSLQNHVPPSVLQSLIHARKEHQLLREDDFSDLLYYALLSNKSKLDTFGTGNPDLARRAENLLEQFDSWSGFSALLKTKNLTHTAVSRYLTHVMLKLHREDFFLAEDYARAPYARLLGFHRSAAPLLKSIQAHSGLPVLSRLARDASSLDEDRRHLLDLNITSSEIYKRILHTKSGSRPKSEYRQSTICVP